MCVFLCNGVQPFLPHFGGKRHTKDTHSLRRAETANRAWVEDVRTRKLCIANGGVVHGIPYDLEGQFGISLAPHRSPAG